jgi:hypothetical protein
MVSVMSTPRRSHKGFVVVLLALGVVLALYVRMLERVAPVVVGARLVASTPRVALAVDRMAFREWQQARHDQDFVLITALTDMGKLFSVANNRRVAVLSNDQTVAVVQILDGAQVGKTGLVPSSFIQRDVPRTATPP